MQDFDSNKIDQFLMGQLPPEEHKNIEDMIQHNEEFARQVQRRRESIAAVELLGDLQMKQRLGELHEKGIRLANQSRRRTWLRPLLASAAAVLLLVVAGWWFFNQPVSSKAMMAEHFQTYDLNFGQRDDNNQAALLRFSDLYRQQRFGEALAAIQNLPTEQLSSKLKLARGIALLSDQQPEQATDAFSALLNPPAPIYSEQARWYLALSYLAQDNTDACKRQLQQIIEKEKHFQVDEAKQLLKKLK